MAEFATSNSSLPAVFNGLSKRTQEICAWVAANCQGSPILPGIPNLFPALAAALGLTSGALKALPAPNQAQETQSANSSNQSSDHSNAEERIASYFV